MCTVVVRVDPGAAWPVTVLALRDESPDRPWDPPAAWWPDRDTGVVGVRDQQAGGAWLAASDRNGLAVVLNRWESTPGVDGTWTTRGTLPLDAVVDGVVPGADNALPTSRAFNLVRATADGAEVVTWDGSAVRTTALGPGVHMVTHGGAGRPGRTPDRAVARRLPRGARSDRAAGRRTRRRTAHHAGRRVGAVVRGARRVHRAGTGRPGRDPPGQRRAGGALRDALDRGRGGRTRADGAPAHQARGAGGSCGSTSPTDQGGRGAGGGTGLPAGPSRADRSGGPLVSVRQARAGEVLGHGPQGPGEVDATG
ncbi:NRDE family protein [Curtobacterium sp. MCPF17_052]|uniref:NRDE family protein n=1 Tax=Curtobacterium sp. MCPF17_052 TaxID=2175655 RepID=UPI0024DF9A9A|nr:NRDE family protein [Curtobacterium sp. MCPF17_052]WIB13168.1 NRDE family protein [Curtobacterium sp. MCPF17_052]